MLITSILEQFEIIPLYTWQKEWMDFSITNQTIMILFIFSFLIMFHELLIKRQKMNRKIRKSYLIVPVRIQLIFEKIFKLVRNVVVNNIDLTNGEKYFPLIFSIFVFILLSNLLGLIPYSFTITSHFFMTFGFSLYLFIGIIISTVENHSKNILTLFLPSGTPTVLALLLTPVELISYIFKPISLSIRLFANMTAGHILLKVITWFAFALGQYPSYLLFSFQLVPLLLLFPLILLELAVAIIQALVFVILISIYINESIKLH